MEVLSLSDVVRVKVDPAILLAFLAPFRLMVRVYIPTDNTPCLSTSGGSKPRLSARSLAQRGREGEGSGEVGGG